MASRLTSSAAKSSASPRALYLSSRAAIGFSDSDENWLESNRRRIHRATHSSGHGDARQATPPAAATRIADRDDHYRHTNRSSVSSIPNQQSTTSTRRRPAAYKEDTSDTYDSYDSYDSYDDSSDDSYVSSSEETQRDERTATRSQHVAHHRSNGGVLPQRHYSADRPVPVAWSVDTAAFRSPRKEVSGSGRKVSSPLPVAATALSTSRAVQSYHRAKSEFQSLSNMSKTSKRPAQEERPDFMIITPPTPRAKAHVDAVTRGATVSPSRVRPIPQTPVTPTASANSASDTAVQQLAQALTALLTKKHDDDDSGEANVRARDVYKSPSRRTLTPSSGTRPAAATAAPTSPLRRRVVSVSSPPAETTEMVQQHSVKRSVDAKSNKNKDFFTYVVPPALSSPSDAVTTTISAMSPNAPRLTHVDTVPLSPQGATNTVSPVRSRTSRSSSGDEILGARTPPNSRAAKSKVLDIGAVAKYTRIAPRAGQNGGDVEALGGGAESCYILTETQLEKLIRNGTEGRRTRRVVFTPFVLSDSDAVNAHLSGQVTHQESLDAVVPPPAAVERTTSPQRAASVVRVPPPLSRPPSIRLQPSDAAAAAPLPSAVSATSSVSSRDTAEQAAPHAAQRFTIPRVATTPPRTMSSAAPKVPPQVRPSTPFTASTNPPVASPAPLQQQQRAQSSATQTPQVSPPPQRTTAPQREDPYSQIQTVMSLETSYASIRSPSARQLSVPRTRRGSPPGSRNASPPPPGVAQTQSHATTTSRPWTSPPPPVEQRRVLRVVGAGSGGESLSPRRPFSPPVTRPLTRATPSIFHA